MAWILRCILWVSLFQISTHATELEGRAVREGERAANRKGNGSYKILNKLVKPFVSKRVEDRIMFPGEYETVPLVFEKPEIPEECREIGICDDIPNYPEELVSNLLNDLVRQNRTHFNKDMLEVPQISQRIGPEDEYVELCDTVEKVIVPQGARDTNDEWHVIVNDKKQPQQTFRVEICKAKESPCSPIAYFQNGYKAKCVQKFMLRNMLAINEQNVVIEKPFKVPSCCSCVARQT